MTIVRAPWSAEQVESLNRYQYAGVMHPFTCAVGGDTHPVLKATEAGWVCQSCDYTQDWAHRFMADLSWQAPVGTMMAELFSMPRRPHVDTDDMPSGVEHTFDGTRRWYPEDVVRQMLAGTWREGWVTGNQWAFTDADEDSIESNPHVVKGG